MNRRTVLKYAVKGLQPCRSAVGRLARLLPDSTANAGTPVVAARGAIYAGLWLMLIVFGVFGLWSGLAPLDSAAVAAGQVVLDSNRKAIQHLEGGIVDEILVREGQRVEEGQPLVKLRGTASKARLSALQVQFFTARAAEARLKAEQKREDSVSFPSGMTEEAEGDETKREILSNQQELFASRRKARDSQVSGLEKKIEEFRHDIEGLARMEAAEAKQVALLKEEIASTEKLFAKGYASKPRLLALQRQAEDVQGRQGQHLAAMARTEESIKEAEEQIAALEQDSLARILSELKETQALLANLREELTASSDVVGRVTITSPISGFVTGLNVHTVGGVVGAGEKLMDIVPAGDKLIVEAHVSPQDIDLVRPGLVAHIRLSAYRSRWVPAIEGKVITVSADRMTEQRTLASYFLARIEVDAEELNRLHDVQLYPGMPAETFIVTGERTLLGYLLMPFVEATRRAFREE